MSRFIYNFISLDLFLLLLVVLDTNLLVLFISSENQLFASLISYIVLLFSISLFSAQMFIIFFYLLLLDFSCLGFSKTLKCIISCFLVVCLNFICKHSNISTSLLESCLLYLKVSDKLCFHFLLWILKFSPVCFIWPADHSRCVVHDLSFG